MYIRYKRCVIRITLPFIAPVTYTTALVCINRFMFNARSFQITLNSSLVNGRIAALLIALHFVMGAQIR